jgi:hypothetical protein
MRVMGNVGSVRQAFQPDLVSLERLTYLPKPCYRSLTLGNLLFLNKEPSFRSSQ